MKRGPSNLPEEVSAMVAHYVKKHLSVDLEKQQAAEEAYRSITLGSNERFHLSGDVFLCGACKVPFELDANIQAACPACSYELKYCGRSFCKPMNIITCSTCQRTGCSACMFACAEKTCDKFSCKDCKKQCIACLRFSHAYAHCPSHLKGLLCSNHLEAEIKLLNA